MQGAEALQQRFCGDPLSAFSWRAFFSNDVPDVTDTSRFHPEGHLNEKITSLSNAASVSPTHVHTETHTHIHTEHVEMEFNPTFRIDLESWSVTLFLSRCCGQCVGGRGGAF